MKLILMRHGEAHSKAASDFDRTLTSHGRKEVLTSVDRLAAYDLTIDLLLVSPYPRAQETAELVNERLGHLSLVTTEAVTPDIPVKEALTEFERYRQRIETLMVVMHQPIISSLVYYLTGIQQPMSTASIAVIDAPVLERDCCDLECVV